MLLNLMCFNSEMLNLMCFMCEYFHEYFPKENLLKFLQRISTEKSRLSPQRKSAEISQQFST